MDRGYRIERGPMSILIAVAALAAAQPISLEQRVTIGQVAATQCSSAIAISVITPEGTASITNGKGLSDSDPVRIASITKTATAAAALRLVEDGLLDLDTPEVGHDLVATAHFAGAAAE